MKDNRARSQKPTLVAKPVSEPKTEVKQGVVWELLDRDQITLQFKNVDDPVNVFTLIIEKGITKNAFPHGHWELTGFEEGGRSFTSMNTTKKFVFRMKPKVNVYAGSLMIGCPTILPADFKLLKKMKFFNRYPFGGTSGLCEMVIGDNFAEVKTALRKSQKSSKLNIVIGF